MRRVLFSLLAASAATVFGAYSYYYTDNLTGLNPGRWTVNGTATPGPTGLIATSANGGSLISTTAVPDGTSEYEVRSQLQLTATGGTCSPLLTRLPVLRHKAASLPLKSKGDYALDTEGV